MLYYIHDYPLYLVHSPYFSLDWFHGNILTRNHRLSYDISGFPVSSVPSTNPMNFNFPVYYMIIHIYPLFWLQVLHMSGLFHISELQRRPGASRLPCDHGHVAFGGSHRPARTRAAEKRWRWFGWEKIGQSSINHRTYIMCRKIRGHQSINGGVHMFGILYGGQ